jgi:lysophospholipase L1-like esterase
MGRSDGRRLKEKSNHSILGNLVLFVIAVVVAVLLSEGGARLLLTDVTTTADNTSALSLKWKERVLLNDLGFREREVLSAKPSTVYRVAVIGDSITYGQGVDSEERFTNILESKLNESVEQRYQVLNFGRPGAETEDHLNILEEHVLKVNPDYVLLQWFINDVEGVEGNVRPRPLRLLPSDALSLWLHRRSVLYYLLNQQWVGLQAQLGIFESYEAYMNRRFADPQSPDSIRAMNTLRRFISLCKMRNLPVGIVLFPALNWDTHKPYPYGFLHERVLTLCAESGITCLDLQTVFSSKGVSLRRYWVNRLDSHPGPLANALAAEAIFKMFSSEWISARNSPLHR